MDFFLRWFFFLINIFQNTDSFHTLAKVEAVQEQKFWEHSDYDSVKIRLPPQNVSWIILADVPNLFYCFVPCMLNVALPLFWLKGCPGRKKLPALFH